MTVPTSLSEALPLPPVTVVVATKDRPALLRAALEAINAALRDGDELIVVDSASSDSQVTEIASVAGAKVLRCDRPGTCRARNAGWRAANTEIVAFTDDDCAPQPAWLDAMSRAFVVGPGASVDFVTGRIVSDRRATRRAEVTVSLHPDTEQRSFTGEDDPENMGHGANMAWRTDALERIGGFDEELGPGAPLLAAEDQDAFWRALTGGGSGRFEPAAVVVHRQWRDRGGQLRVHFGYGVGAGAMAVKRRRMEASGGTGAPTPLGPIRRGARRGVWRAGLSAIGRHVANHYEMGAAVEVVKLAGALRGVALASKLSLHDGHFKPRA